MSKTINRGKELIRISPENPHTIEYSTDGGQNWNRRYSSGYYRDEFLELVDNGKEIVAQMSDGLYYSTDEGRSWNLRRREKRRSSTRSAGSSKSGSSNKSEDSQGTGCGFAFAIIILIVYGAVSGDLFEVLELLKVLIVGILQALKVKLFGG